MQLSAASVGLAVFKAEFTPCPSMYLDPYPNNPCIYGILTYIYTILYISVVSGRNVYCKYASPMECL